MSATTTTSGAPLSPTPLPLPPSSSSLVLQSAASFRIRAPVTADSDSSDFDSNVSDDDLSPAPLHTTTTPDSQNPKALVMPVAQLSLDDDDHHHDLDFDSDLSDEENSALPALVKVPTLDNKSNAVVKSLVFGDDTEEDTDDDNQSVSYRNLDSAQLNSSSGYDSSSVQLLQVANEEDHVLPEGNSAVAAEDVVKHFEVQVENLPVESSGENNTDQNERHDAVEEQEEEESRSIVAADADAGSATRPNLNVEFHENGQIGNSEADNFDGKTKFLLPDADYLQDLTFGGGFEVCSDSQTNNGQMIAVGTEMELQEKRENEKSEEGHFDFEGKTMLPLPDADLQDLTFGGGLEVCSDSQTNSGQMIAVGTEMELQENHLYDSAALASSSPAESEGSSFTMVTSCDESRQAVSPDWSADTGSSSFRGMIPPPPLDSTKVILSEGNVNEEFIVKFLRLIHRLGYSPQHPIAAQVMYSLVGEGYGTQELSFDRLAMELHEEGKADDVDLCLNILVIGKTGVGKSSTINSIFGEKKVAINAFEPATTYVKEVCGTVSGIRIRILDTPGFRPSIKEASANRKILASLKKLTKKSPPDVVLYVDRLDYLSSDQIDVALLSEVTKSLTSSIWENAIVILTHASSLSPEGPSGSPWSFEEFVTRRCDVVHQAISLAVGDPLLMHRRPVALAENQHNISRCFNWNAQLLLMCCSVKILSEAKSVAKFQAGNPGRAFLPLLQNVLFCDDDEYDQRPSFKPLRKSQVEKLSKEQKKPYIDEYDHLKLLEKKQWREEVKEMNSNEFKALLDVPLPTSFDSSYPSFRYRALETTSRILVRPIVDSNGWDHDYGYHGLSIERDHDYGAFAVQVTQDKKRFNLVMIANLQSQVCIGRRSKMDIGVWMNNKRRGKISIKTSSSSSDLQIFAVMGVVPLAMAVLRSIFGERK